MPDPSRQAPDAPASPMVTAGVPTMQQFGWVVVYRHAVLGEWVTDGPLLHRKRSDAVRMMNALRADGVEAHLARVGDRCEPYWGSCTHPSGHEGRHDQDGPFSPLAARPVPTPSEGPET